MWHVVKFPQENTVSAVPASWYVQQSSECFWPPKSFKRIDFSKYVKNGYLPGHDWKPYPAIILGTYDNYSKTREKAAKAQETDTLSTEVDEDKGRGKRKRTNNQKYSSQFSENSSSSDNADSEDSCQLPPFPNIPNRITNLGTNGDKVHVTGRTEEVQMSEPLASRSTPPSSFSSNKKAQMSEPLASRSTPPSPCSSNKKQLSRKPRTVSTVGSSAKGKSHTLFRTFSRSLSPDDLRTSTNTSLVACVETSSNDSNETIHQLLRAIHEDSKEFKCQVMRKLNLINLKLLDVESQVAKMIKNKSENIDDQHDDEDLTNMMNLLPVSLNTFETLENWLKDTGNRAKMTKELSRIGGQDLGEVVKRIMYRILTNELGLQYSWEGAKGKKKFKNLNIAIVIMETVRSNGNTRNATEADIILNIKKWLVRCKGRINKQNQATAGSNAD